MQPCNELENPGMRGRYRPRGSRNQPGSVLGKRTEFRLPPNDPFGGKVGHVIFFKNNNTSVFLKLYVHFIKMVSVKPYGKTL